ncbi:MAG: type II toxin-antitoxin system VapC family toxin [Opitutales bacterium]|nr:type II toxin-antitoxin system VapC family toxin [Opitutales bacterium]
MRTAVDSSVLLDVLTDDPAFAETSEAALRKAMAEGVLMVCETVVAEILPVLGEEALGAFFEDWGIQFAAGDLVSARLAGSHFARYLQRTPQKQIVVPDFLIGAHAQVHSDRLLARDRGYLREYFKELTVWIP